MRQPRPADGMAIALFGRDPNECHAKGQCVACGGPAREFDNERSRKEYEISVYCQVCQNDIFGVDSSE